MRKFFFTDSYLRSRNENAVCILESLLLEAILVYYVAECCLGARQNLRRFGVTTHVIIYFV